MKVMVVNDFAHVNGGAAKIAIASAGGLARRGHAVTFFSAVGPVDCDLAAVGVKVVCTGQHEILKDPNRLRAISQGIWNLKAARTLALLLDSAKPEETVVHLHGWSKALSSSVVRAAGDRGFKIVCSLHDYFVACPNGGFFNHHSIHHCHLKPLSAACVACNCDSRSYVHKLWRVARQTAQMTMGRLPGGVDAFIASSRLNRDVLLPYLPREDCVFQVHNPVDFPLQPPVMAESNRTFVMVGRLSPEKGGTLFARAARECGVPALFVGEGQCRHEIASAYPAAAISGWVSKDRVAHYLSQARALVFPSLWYEGQPLAVLEAAARGVPVIVSDDCAGAESVIDGVTGLHFRGGDVDSLARALRKLQDNALVQRLGLAAHERFWADPPTLDVHVARLERVYNAVLRGPKVSECRRRPSKT